MKYRKKPVVIEAMQYLGGFSYDEMLAEWGQPFADVALRVEKTNELGISTLEGVMRVDLEDWVIRGVKGEFYPCKPDIFEATYQPVGDSIARKCARKSCGNSTPRALYCSNECFFEDECSEP